MACFNSLLLFSLYKFGVFWPSVHFTCVSSMIIRSRNSVCVSSLDSRSLIGIDGLDSDFGTLGVPW
ncbi:hypothetical protein MKX03_003580, partial [Papaver bracteatum]